MSAGGVLFDDFDTNELDEFKELTPLWTVDLNNEDDLMDWLKNDWDEKERRSQARMRVYAENVHLYKGIHFRSQSTRDDTFRTSDGERATRTPRIVMNQIYDFTQIKISKITRFKPAIAVLPTQDEYNDELNAKLVKQMIDSKWEEEDIDMLERSTHLTKYVFGEAYLMVDWNPDKGDMIMPQRMANKLNAKVENAPTKKVTIETQEGKTKTIEQEVRQGDIEYRIISAERMFPEGRRKWNEVEHVTELDFMTVEEARARWPKKGKEIQASMTLTNTQDTMRNEQFRNEVMILTLYHRPSRFLPKGRKIVFTPDVILENVEWPYETKGGQKIPRFPFARITDIDVPNEIHARSFFRIIKQPQFHFNNLASAVARNHGLAATPKWVVPFNSQVSNNALGNELTIVRYKGPQEPRLVNYNPTAPEVFSYMDKLETYMQKGAGISGVSQGEPPPGIKAGVALQFLDEQENERASSEISKRNRFVREVAQLTVDRMAQHYRADDGRMIRIVGKDNMHQTKHFDEGIFHRPYDIKIQNSSALPQHISAKTQALIDLKESFPGVIRDEMVINMLDLAQDSKFRDISTVAVQAANAENDDIARGEPTQDPMPFEDHLLHWDIHQRELQSRSFKERVDSPIVIKLSEHVLTHEMYMWERAKANPLYLQKLALLDNYPSFYKIPNEEVGLLAQVGAAGQQASGKGIPNLNQVPPDEQVQR